LQSEKEFKDAEILTLLLELEYHNFKNYSHQTNYHKITKTMESKFQIELEQLINKHSIESESNTPDFILAEYLGNCLNTFNLALKRREDWYGRNKPSKKEDTLENDAKMLENAAYNLNYHNFCARVTLGTLPATTPLDLLENDYGRVRSASEKEAIREILMVRDVHYDVSRNAYNDWEITLVRMNGCPCGHNGKTVPNGYGILKVRVGDKYYEIGQSVSNDGTIEKFTLDCCGRVIATVDYKVSCPFRHYTKFIDIVNLR
jgi:hypothetical protein